MSNNNNNMVKTGPRGAPCFTFLGSFPTRHNFKATTYFKRVILPIFTSLFIRAS